MRGGRKKTGKSTFSSSTSVSSTSPSTSGVSGGLVGWRGIIISNDGTPCVDGRLALGPCRPLGAHEGIAMDFGKEKIYYKESRTTLSFFHTISLSPAFTSA